VSLLFCSCFLRSPHKIMKSSPLIWHFLSKCQTEGEDFVIFCGLLKKTWTLSIQMSNMPINFFERWSNEGYGITKSLKWNGRLNIFFRISTFITIQCWNQLHFQNVTVLIRDFINWQYINYVLFFKSSGTYIYVSSLLFAHESHDLSQAETKIILVKSWQIHKMTTILTQNDDFFQGRPDPP